MASSALRSQTLSVSPAPQVGPATMHTLPALRQGLSLSTRHIGPSVHRLVPTCLPCPSRSPHTLAPRCHHAAPPSPSSSGRQHPVQGGAARGSPGPPLPDSPFPLLGEAGLSRPPVQGRAEFSPPPLLMRALGGIALGAALLAVALIRPQAATAKSPPPPPAAAAAAAVDAEPGVRPKPFPSRQGKRGPERTGKGEVDRAAKEAKLVEAQTKAEGRLAKNPRDEVGLRTMVKVLMVRKDVKGAIGHLERLQEVNPTETEYSLLLAQACMLTNDLDKTRQALERVLEYEPFHPMALQGLTAILEKEGKGDEAVLMLDGKIAAAKTSEDPEEDVPNVQLIKAQALAGLGKPDEAIQALDSLVGDYPEDFRAFLTKGLILVGLNKADDAQRCFGKCRQLLPSDYPHRRELYVLMNRALVEAKNVEKDASKAKAGGEEAGKPSAKGEAPKEKGKFSFPKM